MTAENIDAETREWLDRLEIQDLISRYSDGVTARTGSNARRYLLPTQFGRVQLWEFGARIAHRLWRS
jgi:hypothetical protein